MLLIKNATLLSGRKVDILIEGNIISKIGNSISSSGAEKIDASNKFILPGFINTHTHAAMTLFRGTAEDMRLDIWLAEVMRREKRLTPKQVYFGTALACIEMIKSGTTCFSDMYFHMDEVARAASDAKMRAVLGYCPIDGGNKPGTTESIDENKMKKELSIAEEFIKKYHKKGTIICSSAPHSVYLCSGQLLSESKKLSEKYSCPLHIHLSETRKEVFDCLSANKKRPAYYLESLGIITKRMVAAHSVYLSKEEVKLLGTKKASTSLNIVSNMKLAGGSVPPLPEMQEFKVNISLGTDGAASNNSLSMFEAMKFTSLAVKNSRWDATAASCRDVFEMATLGGARALGIEAGEIKEGKLADLVLIEKKAPNLFPSFNNIANIVYSAHAGNVTDAIIDGKLVMQERKLLTLDEEKIIEAAQKEAEKLSA